MSTKVIGKLKICSELQGKWTRSSTGYTIISIAKPAITEPCFREQESHSKLGCSCMYKVEHDNRKQMLQMP